MMSSSLLALLLAALVAKALGFGDRALCFSTVVRVWQVEVTRNEHFGTNESAIHTVEACQSFRDAVEKGWPGAKVTWSFSWLALHTNDGNYTAIRNLVAGFVRERGDELTFLPGGYFAPMYEDPNQTNTDIHDALQTISNVVGSGYRPKAIVAGYLSSRTFKYLAEVEKIHVAVGTIFSQFKVDYGDGDGGSPYPYYPSTEHYLKQAQDTDDFIDLVNLDGWTVDLLCARRPGTTAKFNSRMGVGPIETLGKYGVTVGHAEMMAATANHFTTGFALNGYAYVTSIWEIALGSTFYPQLTTWLQETRARWPDARMITHGEFGERWRAAHPNGNSDRLQLVVEGSGIGGSDADKEIRFFVTKEFRLALLRNISDTSSSRGEVIDFTRYDLPAAEPHNLTRSWNLMNVRVVDLKIHLVDLKRWQRKTKS